MAELNNQRRKTNFRSIILVFMMIVAISILILLQTKDSYLNLSGKPMLGKGAAAPDFTLPDLNGNSVSLSDYRGKAVLLNIWATWCPPCVSEMPSMEKLYQNMKEEDFDILAVSIDESGADDVVSFMKKYKLNFTVLTDPQGSLNDKYQTTGIPESYIIDKNGRIVEKIIGPRDWAAPEIVRIFQELARTK